MDFPRYLSDSVYFIPPNEITLLEKDLDTSIGSLNSITQNTTRKIVYDPVSQKFSASGGVALDVLQGFEGAAKVTGGLLTSAVQWGLRKTKGITCQDTLDGLDDVVTRLSVRIEACVEFLLNRKVFNGKPLENEEFNTYAQRLFRKLLQVNESLNGAEGGLERLLELYFMEDHFSLTNAVDDFFKKAYMSLLGASIVFNGTHSKYDLREKLHLSQRKIDLLWIFSKKRKYAYNEKKPFEYQAHKIIQLIELQRFFWLKKMREINTPYVLSKRGGMLGWSILALNTGSIYLFLKVPLITSEYDVNGGRFKSAKFVLSETEGRIDVKLSAKSSMNPIKLATYLRLKPADKDRNMLAAFDIDEALMKNEVSHLRSCQGMRGVPVVRDVCLLDHYGYQKTVLFEEYYDKGSLTSSMIMKLGDTEEIKVKIIHEIILSLHNLHIVKGLVHRDIKLPNILLSSEGKVVLGDWGMVKKDTGDFDPVVGGSPYYMSPEKLHKMIKNDASIYIDEKAADVWAAGCVMWEVLGHLLPWFSVRSSLDLHINHALYMNEPILKNPTSEIEKYVLRFLEYRVEKRIESANMLEEFYKATEEKYPAIRKSQSINIATP